MVEASEQWRWVAGRPLRALVAGRARPGVPEVVLVPGLGILPIMQELQASLARVTRTTLLDLPGFGHRATARLPVDLDALTRATLESLPAPPRAPVVLLGHSTGAQLALRAAAAAPDRVAALVLVGITFTPPVRDRPLRLIPQLRTYLHEQPRELPLALPDLLRGGAAVARFVLEALPDEPEAHLPHVPCPVLVLRGRHDALCPPQWARRLADLTPDGAAVTLPGSHNVPFTHPAAVAVHVERLLLTGAARTRSAHAPPAGLHP